MTEPVNIFTITSYFSDVPNAVQKGLNSFHSNRVVNISVQPSGIIRGKVQASMKKKSYEVEIHVEGQTVTFSTCQCPIGRDKCHHMAAVLIWCEKNMSRTDVECRWNRPTASAADSIEAKRVSEMAPSNSQAGITRPVSDEDREWALAALSDLGRFTGLGWILTPETTQTPPPKTFDGVVASQGYADAEHKRQYILNSLAVTEPEKEQIERATVGQVNNSLWSAYRMKRITASNFGTVLAAVKRNSYPPSLFKTLLGLYNFREGSKACDWGILHEQTAKEQYMKRSGVVIQEKGLFLSTSGLLGGSPDGMVSEQCIIEVKCPWSAREKTVLQAAADKGFFLKSDQGTGSLTLKCNHNYWHQIQGNLHLTRANICHLIVWTPLDLAILTVSKDPAWAENVNTLETFYKNIFLPHIGAQM